MHENEFSDVQSKALKLLLISSAIIIFAVAIRSYVQGAYPTLLGLVICWLLIFCGYVFRGRVGVNNVVWFAIFLLVAAQSLVLSKLGLLSGAPYVLMFTAAFAALIKDHSQRLIALAINLVPVTYLAAWVNWGHSAPLPEDISTYVNSKSTWTSLLVTASLMSFTVVQISSWLMDKILFERNSYRSSLYDSLAQLSLLRDNETGQHIQRCSKFAKMLLGECKLQNYDAAPTINVTVLGEAVKFHDVGKIAISDKILKKEGKLSSDEYSEVQKHSALGAELIRDIAKVNDITRDPVMVMGEQIALHHHENWDGTGYPFGAENGMMGRKIPLESRIMAVVDVYDALRSVRPYKKALSHAKTLEIMTEMRGQKFDPKLFDIFLSVSDRFDKVFTSDAKSDLS
jgi:HD-GYP domain-containing protein (c-di-GMP phosphodiesterase class II)